MGFQHNSGKPNQEIKVETQYGENVEVKVGIFEMHRPGGPKLMEFLIVNSRYSKPKEYHVEFNVGEVSQEKINWFAHVLGHEFAELVAQSAKDMKSYIRGNYQNFLNSLDA